MLDKLIKDIGPNARDAVFHDHLKGRYSEVDEINGLVVELGKDKGIDTSINEQIVKITKKIHLGELEPSIKNLNTFKKYI